MSDPFTPAERSAVMRKVPGQGSSAEIKVRKALSALGVRYRLHRKDLPGSPDVVMAGRRLALFVHGCFWHGHACRRGARAPKANADYWAQKIDRNRARDGRVQDELRALGWRAEAIWECELGDPEALKVRLEALLEPGRGSDLKDRDAGLCDEDGKSRFQGSCGGGRAGLKSKVAVSGSP